MKKIVTFVMAVAAVIVSASFQANPVKITSGLYSYTTEAEDGFYGPSGQIVISTDSRGRVRFEAEAVTMNGNIAYLKTAEWQKLSGNKLTYREDMGDGDYYEVTMEFGDNVINVTDDFSHGGFGLFGMGACLGGEYKYEKGYCPEDGILYEFRCDGAKASVLRSVFGGKEIRIPKTVKHFSDDAEVDMVAPKAFFGDLEVEKVTYANKNMYIGQGAYLGVDALDKGKDTLLPVFALCDESRTRYVHPVEYEFWKDGYRPDLLDTKWVIFKQNLHQINNVEYRKTEADKVGTVFPDRFDEVSGVVCSLFIDDDADLDLEKRMFRGYNAYEIIVLLAGNDYVASHEFPAYSRWKYPEKVVYMPASFDAQMSKYFGRKVLNSKKVANLKDEPKKQLVLVNFELLNDKAMYALVWLDNGTIVSCFSEEAQVIRDEDEIYSPWGVDADIEFGIPDVISIAIDYKGNLDIFLNSDTPESATGYVLRQNGKKFERIELNQWYRYVD